MVKKQKQLKDGISAVLKLGLASIGPEEALLKSSDIIPLYKSTDLYDFKDNLKYNFAQLFFTKSVFNKLVIKHIPKYKMYSNENYAISLCEKKVQEIADRILQREKSVDETLVNYLKDEDIDFVINSIYIDLENDFDNHTVSLLTDLLSLEELGNVKIANLEITTSKDEDKSKYLYKSSSLLSGLLAGWCDDSIIEKKWNNLVLIKTKQKGLHLKDEVSLVAEKAINEFKNFYAYLLLCESKLGSTKDSKFEIRTEFLMYENFSHYKSKGIQKYYISNSAESTLSHLDTKYLAPYLCNKKISLNKESLEKIKKSCFLEKYEKVIVEKNNNEVAKKIIRSMDWFLQASLEEDLTDSVIKYFIALESLFSTGGSGQNNKTICENVAISCYVDLNDRLKFSDKFYKLLQWRNMIVHHGKNFHDNPQYFSDLNSLKIGLTWSILTVISLYDKICALGKDAQSINNYFHNKKLEANLI